MKYCLFIQRFEQLVIKSDSPEYCWNVSAHKRLLYKILVFIWNFFINMFFRLSVLSVVLSEPLTQKHNYQSVLFFFPFQGTPWLHHSIGLVNPDITY